ncbi:MAG: hypothetical protein LIO90_11780, partial [Bacteroidales bacterium]|nr:hypothetical protein [Bacteroidales bacterium]
KAPDYPFQSPYGYCLANPLRYTDLSGLEPSPYESALMGYMSYGDMDMFYRDCEKKLLARDWKISKSFSGCERLGILVFEKEVDGKIVEYACAFAGTRLDSSHMVDDIYNDCLQLTGESPHYAACVLYAEMISSWVGSCELTFLGHSKGGGEAIAGSMSTGRKSITFNSAAVSSETMKALDLSATSNVTNYITSYRMFGIDFINDPVTLLQACRGLITPGEHILVPVKDKVAHSIRYFIEAFEK